MNQQQRNLMRLLMHELRNLDYKQKAGKACPNFNMGDWLRAWEIPPEFSVSYAPQEPVNPRISYDFKLAPDANLCGTACCAMGLAATIPAFRDAGLTLRIDKQSFDFGYLRGQIEFEGEYGINAAAKVFGITYEAASYLFGSSSYSHEQMRDPAYVASRLEVVLNTYP